MAELDHFCKAQAWFVASINSRNPCGAEPMRIFAIICVACAPVAQCASINAANRAGDKASFDLTCYQDQPMGADPQAPADGAMRSPCPRRVGGHINSDRWKRMTSIMTGLVILASLMSAVITPLSAQTADELFYRGKTVRLVVGYGPGGGYDIYARLIAPAIGRALSATVVVVNQPGAGGLTALDRVYRAEPDGLTIMIVNGTPSALAQLVEQQGVRYDLAKMGHLGIVSAAPRVWTVGPNTPFKTPAEALKLGRPIIWAAGGPLDGLADGAAMACEALKMQCQILLGYPGSNEATLSVTKGETDSIYQSDISAQNFARSGQTWVMSILGRERSKLFPDVPTIFESMSLDEDATWWVDYRAKAETLGRILVAPPNMTTDRLAVLQAAVKKGLSEPALIAEGERMQYPIEYGDAEAARKAMVDVVSNLTPLQRARIKSVVLREP